MGIKLIYKRFAVEYRFRPNKRLLLTLYLPRLLTVQEKIASLPTGTVKLGIGDINSGSSEVLVVAQSSETKKKL